MCHPWCRFAHFTTKEASLWGFYAFEQGQLQSSPVSRRVRNVEFEVKLALLRRTVHLLLLLAYQIPKHFISPDSLKSLSSWYQGFILLIAMVGNGVWNVTMHDGHLRGKVASLAVNVICRAGSGAWCSALQAPSHIPSKVGFLVSNWPELQMLASDWMIVLKHSTAAVDSVIHMPTIQGHHYQHYHQTPDNYKHPADGWDYVQCSSRERILNQDVFIASVHPTGPQTKPWTPNETCLDCWSMSVLWIHTLTPHCVFCVKIART